MVSSSRKTKTPLSLDLKLFRSIYGNELAALEASRGLERPFLPSQGFISATHDLCRKYMHDSIYYNDVTYVKLWILFASYVHLWKGEIELGISMPTPTSTASAATNAAIIYEHMFAKKIGRHLSLFYLTAANYFENTTKEISKCSHFLEYGIQFNAEPLEDLLTAKKEFQLRRAKSSPSSRSVIPTGFLVHPLTGKDCCFEERRALDYLSKRQPVINNIPLDDVASSSPVIHSVSGESPRSIEPKTRESSFTTIQAQCEPEAVKADLVKSPVSHPIHKSRPRSLPKASDDPMNFLEFEQLPSCLFMDDLALHEPSDLTVQSTIPQSLDPPDSKVPSSLTSTSSLIEHPTQLCENPMTTSIDQPALETSLTNLPSVDRTVSEASSCHSLAAYQGLVPISAEDPVPTKSTTTSSAPLDNSLVELLNLEGGQLEEIAVIYMARFFLRHLVATHSRSSSRSALFLSNVQFIINDFIEELDGGQDAIKPEAFAKQLEAVYELKFPEASQVEENPFTTSSDESYCSSILRCVLALIIGRAHPLLKSMQFGPKVDLFALTSLKYYASFWIVLIETLTSSYTITNINLLLSLSNQIIFNQRNSFPSLKGILKKYEILLYKDD